MANRTSYMRAWKAANHDKVVASRQRSSAKNVERVRRWRAANPGQAAMIEHRRREAYPCRSQEWKRNHKEQVRAYTNRWRSTHPENVKAWLHRRKRRAVGSFYAHEARLIYVAQDGLCYYCAARIAMQGTGSHVDHLVPLVRGGLNVAANIVWSCKDCNLKKHDRTAAEFMGAASISVAGDFIP